MPQPVAYSRPAPAPASNPSHPTSQDVPEKFRPMSTGQYFVMLFLLAIPLLNLLLLLVWSLGGTSNVNKQNLSRAIMIFMILTAILWAGLAFAMYRGLVTIPGLRPM